MRRLIRRRTRRWSRAHWRTVWGFAVVIAAAIVVGWEQGKPAVAQVDRLTHGVGGAGLISHFRPDNTTNSTQVILVDPHLRRMVVYNVPFDSGEIRLKSVRNLSADFQVQQFNSGEPSPVDMQKMLDRN